MQEILIYIVMKKSHGLVMSDKAFNSFDKAKRYARTGNMDLDNESEFYVEKCFLRQNQK